MELNRIHETGLNATFKSAKVLNKYLGNLSEINKKGVIDLVTEADIESEKVIIETIKSNFPDHSILAEESGHELNKNPEYLWIIDPLDGTTNFAHGLKSFASSIAFSRNGEIVFGMVNNPATQELFSAVLNKGAFLNGEPIQVSKTENLTDSLLVTGFPYNFKEIIKPLMERFTNCLSAAQAVRRLGAASLDLCYVACGRFDGFWEENLKPWDTAAGMFIAREAGAVVTDFSDSSFSVEKNEVLATNGKIHNEMLSLLELQKNL